MLAVFVKFTDASGNTSSFDTFSHSIWVLAAFLFFGGNEEVLQLVVDFTGLNGDAYVLILLSFGIMALVYFFSFLVLYKTLNEYLLNNNDNDSSLMNTNGDAGSASASLDAKHKFEPEYELVDTLVGKEEGQAATEEDAFTLAPGL